MGTFSVGITTCLKGFLRVTGLRVFDPHPGCSVYFLKVPNEQIILVLASLCEAGFVNLTTVIRGWFLCFCFFFFFWGGVVFVCCFFVGVSMLLFYIVSCSVCDVSSQF